MVRRIAGDPNVPNQDVSARFPIQAEASLNPIPGRYIGATRPTLPCSKSAVASEQAPIMNVDPQWMSAPIPNLSVTALGPVTRSRVCSALMGSAVRPSKGHVFQFVSVDVRGDSVDRGV